MPVEQTLESMGLTLPEAAKPVATYVPARRTGNLIFCSGQLPTERGALRWRGRVGAEVSEDDAYEAARIAAMNALAAIKAEIGSLDKIKHIVRVTGYVTSAMGFTNQPIVVDGASDFLVKLFGEAGRHSRVSVGVYQLPLDAPVEIELVVEVGD
jgi:enamine deaminase RidA (YjgF/YER057c/UK114 family)